MYLNLLVLRCKNINQSKSFYEKLGLKFEKEQHDNSPVHYSTKLNETVIELYPLKNTEVDNTRLGFTLDIKNLQEYLNQHKIKIISEYILNSTSVYIVQDPDGRKVELSIHT